MSLFRNRKFLNNLCKMFKKKNKNSKIKMNNIKYKILIII